MIGVVSDFNFRSLHHELLPLAIRLTENGGNVFIKTNANQLPETIKVLEKQWAKFDISQPLDYTFHDEVLAAHYTNDQQAKKLLLILSIISITIACIGLYAISYFIMVRKTKEIGIRKVNGAKLSDVLVLLNRDFLKWVFISFVIASPIAWYVMQKWLTNFAYKTSMSWWIFALAGILALGIAFITLSLSLIHI